MDIWSSFLGKYFNCQWQWNKSFNLFIHLVPFVSPQIYWLMWFSCHSPFLFYILIKIDVTTILHAENKNRSSTLSHKCRVLFKQIINLWCDQLCNIWRKIHTHRERDKNWHPIWFGICKNPCRLPYNTQVDLIPSPNNVTNKK